MILGPMDPKPPSSRGKWLAAVLVALGLIGAIAGVKFRVLQPLEPVVPATPTTQPASR